MAILQCIIILMMAMVSCTLSLVVWEKYPSIDPPNRCALPDGRILYAGTHVNHYVICGEILCFDKDGTTAITYCQRPVPFQECNETGINTYTFFPECCWECVVNIDC